MTGKSTVTLSIHRFSKVPPVFLVASFTEPAWEPVELDFTRLPTKPGSGVAEQSQDAGYEFSGQFEVPRGTHWYRFRLGSEDSWALNKDVDTAVDEHGIVNNVLIVESDSGVVSKKDNEDSSADQPATENTLEVANSADSPGDKAADNVKQPTKDEVEPEPNTSAVTELASENEPATDKTATPFPDSTTQQPTEAKEDPTQGLGGTVENKKESNILATAESREAEPAEPLQEEGTTSREAPVSDTPSATINGSHKPDAQEGAAGEILEQQPQTEQLITPANDVKPAEGLPESQGQEESNPWNPAYLPESPIEQENKDEPRGEPSKTEQNEQLTTQQETVPVNNDTTKETGELESNPWNPASLPESPAEMAEETQHPQPSATEANDKPPMGTHSKETEGKESEGTTAVEIPPSDGNLPVKEPEVDQPQNMDTPSENYVAEKAEGSLPPNDEAKDASAQQPSAAVETPVGVTTSEPEDNQAPSPAVGDDPVETTTSIPEDNQAASPAVADKPVEVPHSAAEDNESAKLDDVAPSTDSTTQAGIGTEPTKDVPAAEAATAANIQPTPAESGTGPAEEENEKNQKEVENEAVGAAQGAPEQQGPDDVMPQRSEEDRPEQLSSTDKVEHGPPEPSPDVKPQEVPQLVEDVWTTDDSAPEIPVQSVAEPEPPVSEDKKPVAAEDPPTEIELAEEESSSVPAADTGKPVISARTEQPEKLSTEADGPTHTKHVEREAEEATPTSVENTPANVGPVSEDNASVPGAGTEELVTGTKIEQPEKLSSESDEPTLTKQVEHKTDESIPTSASVPAADTGEPVTSTTTEQPLRPSSETDEPNQAKEVDHGVQGSIPTKAEEANGGSSSVSAADIRDPVASAQPEQTENPPIETDESTQAKPIEHDAEETALVDVVDKPAEETTSATEDQQTTPPEKESDPVTELRKQPREPEESFVEPSSEPPIEVKDDVLTNAERPTTAIRVSEQETSPEKEDPPKDESTPLLETTAPAVPSNSYQTNGSTTIVTAEGAEPVVTTEKPEEKPPQETSKQKGLPEEPSIPEPAETKNADVQSSAQQPKSVDAAVPVAPPQPEIVVSHETSPKSDELTVNGQNATAASAAQQELSLRSSSAKPADVSSASAQEGEASTTEAAGRDASSHPATSGKSVSSFPVHKKQGFFRALWRAVFVNFFGGLFAPFRRRKQHTE